MRCPPERDGGDTRREGRRREGGRERGRCGGREETRRGIEDGKGWRKGEREGGWKLYHLEETRERRREGKRKELGMVRTEGKRKRKRVWEHETRREEEGGREDI